MKDIANTNINLDYKNIKLYLIFLEYLVMISFRGKHFPNIFTNEKQLHDSLRIKSSIQGI